MLGDKWTQEDVQWGKGVNMGLCPRHFSPSNFLRQRLCVPAGFTSMLESQSREFTFRLYLCWPGNCTFKSTVFLVVKSLSNSFLIKCVVQLNNCF